MANIKLTDLTDLDNSIQELSESELALQGGKRRSPAPMLPPPVVSDWPTPVDPGFDVSFLPPFANFYI
jgi:hypothetical protein